jgi:hypothetical protein
MEGQRKITQNFNQDSRYCGQESNRVPLALKSEVLLLQPTCSVIVLVEKVHLLPCLTWFKFKSILAQQQQIWGKNPKPRKQTQYFNICHESYEKIL